MKRIAATTATVLLLGVLGFALLPAAVSGPWVSLLQSAVVAGIIGAVAWWQAARRRGRPRVGIARLAWVAGASLLAIGLFFGVMSAPWLPLRLPGWILVLAALLCLAPLGLVEQRRLRWLPLVLLAVLPAFVIVFAHVPPAQLPTLATSWMLVALHLAVDVLLVLLLLHLARRRASPALLLPALFASVTSTANLYHSTLLTHPVVHGDLSIHPSRDIIAHPDEVLAILDLQGGESVADIGAGSGYYSFKLARAVGPEGRVVATDHEYGGPLGEAMRARVADRALNPHDNVTLHTHGLADSELPEASFDLVLMSQVTALLVAPERVPWVSRQPFVPWPKPFGSRYHEEVRLVRSLYDALRPGGRLAVINMLDDPDWPFPRSKLFFYYAHRESEVVRNFEAIGFRLVSRHDLYTNEAHQRAMERFQQEPDYETMATFFMGRSKFFLVFEKPGG